MTPPHAHSGRRGFTLMETLAAVLITSLIVSFALGAYVQIADTAERATLRLREDLHATTILDRIADDIQSTVLVVKPPETDPLSHPWYFVSESQQSFEGSDALRFIGRRSSRSYVADDHASDFSEIAYQVDTEDDGTQTLYRWSRPGLPSTYEAVFPFTEDERSHVLGEGLSRFNIRFLDGEGEWVDTWDSTQLEQSSSLPVAVEIGFDFGAAEGDEGFDLNQYRRRVVLPMLPIDMQGMIVAAIEKLAGIESTGDDDDEDGEGGQSAEARATFQCLQQACLEQASGEQCAMVNQLGGSATAAQLAPFAQEFGCD